MGSRLGEGERGKRGWGWGVVERVLISSCPK